jgi:hypothetical protein
MDLKGSSINAVGFFDVNLSAVIGHEINSNQMPGYLLSGESETFAAVVFQELLLVPAVTGHQKGPAIEVDQSQVVEPASAVVRIETSGTSDNIRKNLFHLLPGHGSTPGHGPARRENNPEQRPTNGRKEHLHSLLKAVFPLRKVSMNLMSQILIVKEKQQDSLKLTG